MNTACNHVWLSITEHEPPRSAALDESSVCTTDRVLVTNNINSRDRMGRMSHVWLAAPLKSAESDTGWVAYDEADRKITNITHWMDPFADLKAAELSTAKGKE